jgi:hypothetical protein
MSLLKSIFFWIELIERKSVATINGEAVTTHICIAKQGKRRMKKN